MSRVVVNEIEAKVGNDITFNDTVKIDTLKGKTTAGSVTVQGEGTATTNLQQGLAKVWCNHQQAGTFVLHDSFNISSVVDQGAGHAFPQHTNNMSSGKYGIALCCNQVNYNTSSDTTLSGSNSSSQHTAQAINTSNTGTDASYMSSTITGDLA